MDIYLEDDIIKNIHEVQLKDKEINEAILHSEKGTNTEGEHAEIIACYQRDPLGSICAKESKLVRDLEI